MLVKVLEFDFMELKQAERELVEYLNSGWEIKGQSEGDNFLHYTLVFGKPNPNHRKAKEHRAYEACPY